MKRREFITLLGGAAAWPFSARAQQAARLPTIGFFGFAISAIGAEPMGRSVCSAAWSRELGWIEGQTVAIEYRWAAGQMDRASEIASEFVRLQGERSFSLPAQWVDCR